MSDENEKLIEIDRGQVTKMGGTLYIKIPKSIMRQDNVKFKDTMVYYKSPDVDGTIIKKLKEGV